MAGLIAIASTSASVSLTDAANYKTVLQVIAPSNKGLRIKGFGVTFDGTSSTAARAKVSFGRSSTNGSGGTSVTPQKESGHTGSVTATANQALSSEPTIAAGADMGVMNIPPTNGVDRRLGDFILNPSEAFNLRVAAAGVGAQAYIDFEE